MTLRRMRVSRSNAFGTAAGLVAPAFFAAVAVGLTVHEHAFLDGSGWTPVHRAPVEWPSLLALGPDGWVMSATFAACGGLGLLFARAAYFHLPAPLPAGLLLAALAVAVTLEAFPADAPTHTGDASWHDRIHGSAYPVIPTAAVAGAAIIGYSLWPRGLYRQVARVSLGAAAAMLAGAIASLDDDVAQLARYVLFAALLVWLEALALTVAKLPPSDAR